MNGRDREFDIQKSALDMMDKVFEYYNGEGIWIGEPQDLLEELSGMLEVVDMDHRGEVFSILLYLLEENGVEIDKMEIFGGYG